MVAGTLRTGLTMRRLVFTGAVLLAALLPRNAQATGLGDDLGRNDVRVYSGQFHIDAGRTVLELDLPGRLKRLGYTRRRGDRPQAPGEFFFGNEKFWIYRHEVRIGGKRHPARLIGLKLRQTDGLILEGMDDLTQPLHHKHIWIEPGLLAESFDPNRALSIPVSLRELPKHVWQPVLAAEDARFFEHSGVDAKSLARAMLRNAKAGKVVQGGSTITQQLVKMRDLSPKRSLGRKASEAARALALEAEYDKTEILEAYLNVVYYGHIEGIQIYGLGTAAKAYFSKSATKLSLEEAAVLAAMIQGPNRLSPVRNPDNAVERYRWVLTRMVAVDWLEPSKMHAAQRRGLPELRLSTPSPSSAPHFLDWLESTVEAEAPKRAEEGRGAVVYSTLDPLLQEAAEDAVRKGLRQLRSSHPPLRSQPLGVALVALDGRNGNVLAYIGGDPDQRQDGFDRARRAKRQPGSTVKPLVLLEAFQTCGQHGPLYPARQVSDRPVTLDLPAGEWSPENPDRKFRDSVSVREATVRSLNVPFVRLARRCGFENTAQRFRASGLELPAELPPSFVLGAVETTPLDLASAYTVYSSLGKAWRPRPYGRMALPGGRLLDKRSPKAQRVVKPASAYLIRDLMEDSVRRGTAAAAALTGHQAFGKTGTSSEARDAWFAGGAGSVVTVVWVGLDDNRRLGLSGSQAAAPIWRAFMEQAVPKRAPWSDKRPATVIERWIQTDTGLLVSRERGDAELDLFRGGALPPKRKLLKRDEPIPVIE